MKRRWVIATVDGDWHRGDWIEDEELEKILKEVDGDIGTNPKTGRTVRAETVEEAYEVMSDFLKYDTSLDTQVFSIEIQGVTRNFNVCHIMHWQVETDENTDPLFG